MSQPEGRRFELVHDRGVTRLAVVEGCHEVADELRDWVTGRQVFVVTSAPIWSLHGEATLGSLRQETESWQILEVPDGEAAKDLEVARDLWQAMLAAGARRDSLVLTFGGGSVCDLGAFAAATYMRGVAFSHVPTTLLAQVDAAIGGKSAINLAAAKNVVGVFQQPARVVAAAALLETLPSRQTRAGLVEVIKVAALLDEGLFGAVEANLGTLLAGGAAWADIVAAAQQAKAAVVMRDPLEAGERRVLNFGHTLGHALEVALGYGVLAHGEAVAYGIYFALQLAAGRRLAPELRRRLEGVLDGLALPALPRPAVEEVLAALQRDKKAGPEGAVWVLPIAFGEWEAVALSPETVAAELGVFVARHCEAC